MRTFPAHSPLVLPLLLAATGALATPVAAAPQVVMHTPGMTTQSLAGRADTDVVQFPDGRKLRVRDLRRLEVVKQRLQTPQTNPRSAALAARPAATGKAIKSRTDLLKALQQPDTDTVRLPSGQLVTIGQIKAVQPEVEKRLGRKLDAPSQRPDLSGPAIKITSSTTRAEWEDIFRTKPDATVLESPNGKRITVGELKQRMPKKKAGTGKPAPLTPAIPRQQGVTP
jgi:hypothetical protein